MKKITSPLLLLTLLLDGCTQPKPLPKPTHVIVVIEENKAYSNIIGNPLAPTFTALSKTTYTANFTHDYAITHPSEPNYLDLFSGSDQGITWDVLPGPAPAAPFNYCNLGASLIQKGYTFIGYSEDQPSAGSIHDAPPYYMTKHCPWINWVGADINHNGIPESSDLPFSSFPDSNHYNTLPTVAWIIPDMIDDMHDGPSNSSIPAGDNWFRNKIMPLIRWASNPANNTVVITTWDEDDGLHNNNIPLLVSGGMVSGGYYSDTLNHYSVLKTVEDMYKLPECGMSDSAKGAVDFPGSIWK